MSDSLSLRFTLSGDYLKHLFFDTIVMQIPAANTEITIHGNTGAASPVFGAPALPEVPDPFPEPVPFPAAPFTAVLPSEPDALDLSNMVSSVSTEAKVYSNVTLCFPTESVSKYFDAKVRSVEPSLNV